jgi:AcrR family transcriptional regulator
LTRVIGCFQRGQMGKQVGAIETVDNSSDELSLDLIIKSAVAILDAGGSEALSMRSLAKVLQKSHTAVYRYVADKDELLSLATDAVQDDIDLIDQSAAWDDRLRMIVRHGWVHCWRPHPWVADYLRRSGPTPKALRRQAIIERIYIDAGIDRDRLNIAIASHWSFILGFLSLAGSAYGSDHRRRKNLDKVFEFKLEVWIAGIRQAGSHTTKRT